MLTHFQNVDLFSKYWPNFNSFDPPKLMANRVNSSQPKDIQKRTTCLKVLKCLLPKPQVNRTITNGYHLPAGRVHFTHQTDIQQSRQSVRRGLFLETERALKLFCCLIVVQDKKHMWHPWSGPAMQNHPCTLTRRLGQPRLVVQLGLVQIRGGLDRSQSFSISYLTVKLARLGWTKREREKAKC